MNISFGKVSRDSYESTVEVIINGKYVGSLYREHYNEGISDWAPDEDLRAEIKSIYDSGWRTLAEAKRDVIAAAKLL